MLGGRYQIIESLGQGGFGVTFLALDLQRPNHPKCVVKQFKPIFTNPYALQTGKRLFDQEAQMLEKLGNHDQIPRLLAHIEENQEFYLVQEFIEGHDLEKELPHGQQLSETFVIQLLQDILEVLAFVHNHNTIHRDIKPSNIRRRESDNKIVLIDFGTVKQITKGQTNYTVAVGTIGYMPSEQANHSPHFSSDVYAVGIIGIQALTGMIPKDLPRDPHTGEIDWRKRAQVSQEFADVLDKMVRYDFRLRYQSADEALQALRAISPSKIKGHPVTVISGSSQPSGLFQKFLRGLAIVGAIATAIFLLRNIIPADENFLNYDNSSHGIKIKYPQNWELQNINNPITNEVVIFLSPRESNTDKFQEKLTITVENFSGTLDEFKDSSIKDISNHLSQAKIVNTGTTTLAYKSANQLVFTGKDGENSLKNLQVFTLKGDKAYVITYTAEIDKYDTFIQTAEKMVKSFEFQ